MNLWADRPAAGDADDRTGRIAGLVRQQPDNGARHLFGCAGAFHRQGLIQPDARAAALSAVGGHAAVVSGSCSSATNGQVHDWLAGGRPGFRIDVLQLAAGAPMAAQALAWAAPLLPVQPVLVYATTSADEVKSTQQQLGVEPAGALVEACLAAIATGLLALGVRRLVVAGGETSGAVVQALDVKRLRVGLPIDPGVPWTQAEGRPLLLALKSGNFGSVDFFAKALSLAP